MLFLINCKHTNKSCRCTRCGIPPNCCCYAYLRLASPMLHLVNDPRYLIQAFGVSDGATPCPNIRDSGVNEHPWSLNACCHTNAGVKLPVPDNAALCSTWVWMALSFVINEWTWGSEWTGAHTQTEKVQDEWPNQNICCYKCNRSCTYSKYYRYTMAWRIML